MSTKLGDLEEGVRQVFQNVPKVAFTIDGWTSKYQNAFVGVTAHWIDALWQQREVLLGFEPIKGRHTGQAYMNVFVSVVERFHLEQKVLSITSDNASNMIKMMELLQEYTEAEGCKW